MHETDVELRKFPNHKGILPRTRSFLSELIRFAIVAAIIVIPIRLFIAQPFVVSGASMYPTFENGEYLIVDELSYHLGEAERGDVAIFKYPLDQTKFFIKRIIGLPGESIAITNGVVTVTEVDGTVAELEEPYLQNISDENFSITLETDEYFVMGDNRPASSDSRIWGALPEELLVGKAFIRLLPITRIDHAPGKYDYLLD